MRLLHVIYNGKGILDISLKLVISKDKGHQGVFSKGISDIICSSKADTLYLSVMNINSITLNKKVALVLPAKKNYSFYTKCSL